MRKTRSQTARTQAENAATSSSPGHQSSSSAPIAVNPFDVAKYKECEQMVQMLRVVELQKILSFLNISFAGRKTDLQSRILSFLRTNLELLAPKVQEVYAQSVQEQSATLQYIDPTRMYSHIQLPPTVQPNPVGLGGGPGVQVPGGQMNVVGGTPFLHTHSINNQLPIHPDVRLKKLAFYDVLGTLIKPSTLVPRNTQRVQEVPFYFTLTPQQATEIASNRDIRNSSKVEHAIQVQLRFCLVETSCDQEDCFPPNVNVKVNNKLCQLPNVIPTNRPNVEPKRPPRPVNVTSNVKLSPTVTNTIMVQWCPDYTRSYCLAVYLVKKLTSAQLLQRMKTKGVKPADYTRGLIKEKLTEDADCEIATTMLKVSLNCPLGKMKMLLPCRASTCSHLQCFDASLYLQMNERKPTWNCPVCDKPAIYDNLVIDGYFQEVLGSQLLKSDDTEIQLHQDGSWSTPGLRSEAQILDTPSKPVQKVEVISDDIELISDDAKPVKSDLSPAPDDQPTSTSNSETVDLTLSDSDDDMPLAKRRPPAKQAVASSTSNGSGSVQRAYTPAQQAQQSESPEQQVRRQSPEMQPVLDQQLQQLQQQQQQHDQPATAAVHASLLESLAAAVADQKHFQLLDLAAVAAAAAATASSGQGQNAAP
ncbi:E3 SUMO-protein ligase PIAS2 isoform X1 [Drosophila ficusphila]|uniref:E3 SUMO-protein ligase PIAS2 isoform X1 n=2 Tax=Drosophila ficusphila TaxID=30025 RepID=UPI0007E66CB5|nr:E3 SUMO-protein ligase PIAS2 isoform X1 [Drosophila ficusphila]